MDITTIQMGPTQTNTYLVADVGHAIVIDPAGQPGPIVAHLLQEKLILTHILLTHLHFDQLYGVRSLNAITDAPVYACFRDNPLMETPFGKGGMWGMPEVEPFAFANLDEGDLHLLKTTCKVLYTPGHTRGSLSFYLPTAHALFCGDTLFRGSIGRTDLPGADQTVLRKVIETRFFPMPGETVVYPGHGKPTTIGHERLNNPLFADSKI